MAHLRASSPKLSAKAQSAAAAGGLIPAESGGGKASALPGESFAGLSTESSESKPKPGTCWETAGTVASKPRSIRGAVAVAGTLAVPGGLRWAPASSEGRSSEVLDSLAFSGVCVCVSGVCVAGGPVSASAGVVVAGGVVVWAVRAGSDDVVTGAVVVAGGVVASDVVASDVTGSADVTSVDADGAGSSGAGSSDDGSHSAGSVTSVSDVCVSDVCVSAGADVLVTEGHPPSS